MGIIDPAKQDAPRRTDQGARMWCCPSYTVGTPEVVYPAGCEGCAKIATHNVAEQIIIDIPWNQSGGRYAMIPVAERPDVETYARLEGLIAVWDYWLRGRIGNSVLYNAGEAGDNADQRERVRIVGGGEGYLDVEMMDPRRWTHGQSRLNPLWPLPDPETGETSRLIWTSKVGALPPCATSVEFLPPSVLAGKVEPLVTRISPPDGDVNEDADVVEVRLHFDDGINLENATEPFDAAFPAENYYAYVRAEFLRPQGWRDYQAPGEMNVSPQEMIFLTAGEHELLDGEGESSRVLFPAMASNAMTVVFSPAITTDWTAGDNVRTVLESGVYKSYIDFGVLEFDSATVSYWAVSTASDSEVVPMMGQCVESRVDLSESYIHGDGPQHCGRVDSTGFEGGHYHQNCWLPGRCDRFRIADESIGTVGDYGHWSGLWTRAGWVVSQGIPGVSQHRNFSLEQMGGPSVAAMLGGMQHAPNAAVPGGMFEQREEFGRSVLGVRITWDEDDGEHQELWFGAFYKRPYSHHEDAEYVFDPEDDAVPALGVLPNYVDGWVDGKHLAGYPCRYTGETNVYTQRSAGTSSTRVNQWCESETYIPGADVTAIGDAALVTWARVRFG